MYKLSEYSNDWKLTVNVAKTKVVVFRNGRLRPNECWTYRDHVIDHFNYLGLVFNYNGKYSLAEKTLLGQGRKALFALIIHV
jgi:hypothetical protein